MTNHVKILVVLGDGGHTTEMLALLQLMGNNYRYSYMMSDTDHISDNKIEYPGPLYKVPLPLGKHTYENGIPRFVMGIWNQLVTLLKVRPHLILSTGANIAIPISFFGRLIGVRVVHIETGSRVYAMSSTGKVMYYLANLFFVQWEPLQEQYPKAIYAGRII